MKTTFTKNMFCYFKFDDLENMKNGRYRRKYHIYTI